MFLEGTMTTYSTGEAETKLGEILRKVKEGETVVLLDGEEAVAEIRPVGMSVEDTFRELEEEGVLGPPPIEPRGELTPLAVKPGALTRFLESRR
jgi:antitoxin (DNA-binding transcriptional repressor) of toxin-antitoxin stability system